MDKIKLLIVDDVEDNRLVLRAICRKLEGFEIFEAVDGRDAVDQCEVLHPHIILMDIMMPRLDGFQASRIIKEHYPNTIIMAVTAVIDPKMEENMAAVGVEAYIRKPIDKELLRLKLQSYAGSLCVDGHEKKISANTATINPFSDDIRNFKTIFDIHSIEAIMDFGVWLLMRFECTHTKGCVNIDRVIELLYELLHQEIKSGATMIITIEESFDELFVHALLPKHLQRDFKMDHLIALLGENCVIHETMVAFRLSIGNGLKPLATIPNVCKLSAKYDMATTMELESQPKIVMPAEDKSIVEEKEMRRMDSTEYQVLRQSFEIKMTAKEYIAGIDADTYGEIRDLQEMQEEWSAWMGTLRGVPVEEDLNMFADEILSSYASRISALYEFSGLSYAMVSLSALIKANASMLVHDNEKRANTVTFLEGFKNDISSWIEHVFELQDAQDIHYLDGSFFSSCMIIESIITGVEVDTGDEGEIEFF